MRPAPGTRIRCSDLLESRIVDQHGKQWGQVHDALVVQDGPLLSSGLAAFRLHGLVAGRAAFGTRLGYADRFACETVRGPLVLRAVVLWLHRKAVFIPWDAVRTIDADRITVEAPAGGFHRAADEPPAAASAR